MQLGIDFGTCNSSAACMNNEEILLIKDPTTQGYSIPSSVFVAAGKRIFVGKTADNQRKLDPESYRRELKRELGLRIPLRLGNYEFQPQELIVHLIRKIKSDADAMMSALEQPPFTGVVLTVPATYGDHMQDLMREIAVKAGFLADEVTLLEEPVATAWYYAYTQPDSMHDGEILLVYDLGGGTFDTALLQKQGNSFNPLGLPAGDPQCGGIYFDLAIYHDCKERYPEVKEVLQREDSNKLLRQILLGDYCTDLKHQLSEVEQGAALILLPDLNPVFYQLWRREFEQMISPTIHKTLQCCRDMVQSANITYEQISHILLVGGSCRIPYVREQLKREFACPISPVIDPELVVCQGAAVYAASLTKPIAPQSPNKDTSVKKPQKPYRPRYDPNRPIWD